MVQHLYHQHHLHHHHDHDHHHHHHDHQVDKRPISLVVNDGPRSKLPPLRRHRRLHRVCLAQHQGGLRQCVRGLIRGAELCINRQLTTRSCAFSPYCSIL